jgi:hypothetical protein
MRAMRILAPVLLLLLGSAEPQERSFLVSGFDRVRVDGPFEVEVVSGAAPEARASGSRESLDRVAIRADGSTLVVSAGLLGNEVRAGKRIEFPRVTIVAPRLRAVFVSGGGRVKVTRLAGPRVDAGVNGSGTLDVSGVDADAFAATLTGTGAMTFSGKAVQASFNSYGAGSIDASTLVANDLIVRGSSSGEGRYAARYTARVSALGVGSIRVEGRPKCFVSGSGPVSCAGDNVETD